MSTRKLSTKIVAAFTVAALSGVAGGALAAYTRDDIDTRPWQDQAVHAGLDAYGEYIQEGCVTATDQQIEAYTAARALSPEIFGHERLNPGMCAAVPAPLPRYEPTAARTAPPTPAPVPPTTSA